MTIPNNHNKPAMHPLMIVAAVAVVLFCGVGTAAIMGWLPNSNANGSVPGMAPLPGQLSSMPPAEQPAGYGNGSNGGNGGNGNNANNVAGNYAASNAGYNAPSNTSNTSSLAPNSGAARANQDWDDRADRTPQPEVKQASVCKSCGVIQSVRSIEHRPQGSGVGAAGGAILGGLLGNQVGGGHGRQLATVAGAVGGAVAGNQVESSMKTTHTWRIVVRMDNGTTRTINQSTQPSWGSGDAVRVVNGQLRSID
jgi:outer membrane lipoprotein SlyB